MLPVGRNKPARQWRATVAQENTLAKVPRSFDAPPRNRYVPLTRLLQAYGEGAMRWLCKQWLREKMPISGIRAYLMPVMSPYTHVA